MYEIRKTKVLLVGKPEGYRKMVGFRGLNQDFSFIYVNSEIRSVDPTRLRKR